MQGLERLGLQLPERTDQEVAQLRSGGHAQRDVRIRRFEQQVVVAGRQALDDHETILDVKMIEAIRCERAAAEFEQRQFAARWLAGTAQVRQRDRFAHLAVHGLLIGVAVTDQRPGVLRPVRTLGSQRRDVGERAEHDTALGIGLEYGVHGVAEIAMLEHENDGSRGARLTCPASEFQDILAVRPEQMQVFDFLGAIDAVEGEFIVGSNVDLGARHNLCDLGRQPQVERRPAAAEPGIRESIRDLQRA